MQNRHSMEIKQLLQKKRLSRNRYNPQSRILITSPLPLMKQSRQIKTSSSTHTLLNQQQTQVQLECMQKRYQDLYLSYQKIHQQTRKRAKLCKNQQQEIYKYTKACQRDKKQIYRLKMMIGFINQSDNYTQTSQKSETITKSSLIIDNSKKNLQMRQMILKDSGNPTVNIDKKGQKEFFNNSKIYLNQPYKQQQQNINLVSRLKSSNSNQSLSQSKLMNKSRENLQANKEKNIKRYMNNQLIPSFEKAPIVNVQGLRMIDSRFIGKKTGIELRKKKTHISHNSSQIIINSGKFSSCGNDSKNRYKFIPSIQLL